MSKVSFYSNYINHHQLPFSKKMFELTNGDYYFISQKAISEKRIALGYKNISNDYPFVVKTYESEEELNKAYKLALDSDYVIFGATKDDYVKERLKQNKITFEYSERLNKRKPSLLLWVKKYGSTLIHRVIYKRKKLFLLCSGTYVANDFKQFNMYQNKTYKWGYFPESIEYDVENLMDNKSEKMSILWAGRLIDWKHPELLVKVAKKLKEDGYDFEMNIIGQGVMEKEIKKYINDCDLNEYVHMLGSMSPQDVRKHMEKANIYLFTSDFQEGWGAVLNEAMNSGCACIVSHAIGSAGFLIKHNENGLIYKNGDFEDLYSKVKSLFDNKNKTREIGIKAYNTIHELWNADVAAERFLVLAEKLDKGEDTPFIEGPCSKAIPIPDDKMYDYLVS